MKIRSEEPVSEYLEVGVDVSKHKLDVYYNGEVIIIENTTGDIQRLVGQLAKEEVAVRVSLEATGCYTRKLINACLEHSVAVSLLNARHVRAFARAQGKLAKTDKIDAVIIVEYATYMDPPCLDKGWSRREIFQQLDRRLNVLIATRAERKASLDHYGEVDIRAEIKREILALSTRIKTYEEKVSAIIQEDAVLKNRQMIMKENIGVGEATARSLLVHMPELGSLNRRQAAALAGLAPMNRDSGAARGKRTIQAGRAEPRKALYMAALTAAHKNPIFIPTYKNLREKGKPVKVALTAVARKLLILLNTQLKTSPQII